MIKPIVHFNGTSRNALLLQYKDSRRALRGAIEALEDAAPHGRDYYPHKEEDCFKQAQREHLSRVERLRSVLAELTEIYDTIIGAP